jgi:excinuclease ABC subunit C
VYLFFDKEGKIIYVGKAKNLKTRVSSYFSKVNLGEKTKILVSQVRKIKTIEVASEIEAFLLEERLIKKYTPRYNTKLTDGKRYPSLKITVKDRYPKVLLVRKQEGDNARYFGPYTSTSSLRTVLKILRRIFPYQAVLNHPNKLCLYYHLGLCPCPSVTKDENYRKNINHILAFLEGDKKLLLKDLEKERNQASKDEDFEKAKAIQKQIKAITLVTSSFYKPFEYELNPNLRSDVVALDLQSLKEILKKNNVPVLDLHRIECYDVSNTSGLNATGSMVVFTNGEKDSSSYRRFKMKRDYKSKPNDFAMLQEVLGRRLKHNDWPKPFLIIVDGGKGQVSSAKKVINNLAPNIPLIGLAKRDEIIITSDLKEIKLSKDSPALQLIMRLRDEAHRFAITYHKKLRSKSFLQPAKGL